MPGAYPRLQRQFDDVVQSGSGFQQDVPGARIRCRGHGKTRTTETEFPILSRLKCPALIIAGQYDAFMAVEVAESMMGRIDDATLKILPTGHAAAIESPEEFNRAVIDFMNRIQA